MIRRTFPCLALLVLVACAQPPRQPSPPPALASVTVAPAETSVEAPVAAVAEPETAAPPLTLEEARAAFVRDTAARFNLPPEYVESVLAQAVKRDDVIALMSKPAERVKPWNEYRASMLTAARINAGNMFLAKHREALQREEKKYGVPAEIITAILGVETSYGRYIGKHRVLDALYTLAFFYPGNGDAAHVAYERMRADFFRDELAQLFALCSEEKLDIFSLTGSYAGAMGMAQFMPSSYRALAADGDGDGRRDLYGNYDDVFASVANYFVQRGGWVRGGPVAAMAGLQAGHEEFNPDDWQPVWTLADLNARGYTLAEKMELPADATATPVTLQLADGKQYWLGFRNYYAITRYNKSKMYAMAVYQLAQALE
jgi:membrane-bound lytic murein transglycosylase B